MIDEAFEEQPAGQEPSPGTESLVATIEQRAAATPDYQIGGKDVDPQEWSEGYADLQEIAPEIRDFERGDRFFNPEASLWDYITAPVETFFSLGSRALTGGIIGLDPEFTGRDVFGIKGQTDLSHAASGIYGPQSAGSLQVDIGPPTSSLGLMGTAVPDLGTVSMDKTGVGFHSTFGPQGMIGKPTTDAIKGASSFYAGGGLASLPQISHSGLYRAMGRG